jgi:hypothetical protein
VLLASIMLPIRTMVLTAGGLIPVGEAGASLLEGWMRVVSRRSPTLLNEMCRRNPDTGIYRWKNHWDIRRTESIEGAANCSTKCTTGTFRRRTPTGTETTPGRGLST